MSLGDGFPAMVFKLIYVLNSFEHGTQNHHQHPWVWILLLLQATIKCVSHLQM